MYVDIYHRYIHIRQNVVTWAKMGPQYALFPILACIYI